ncbi:hypothetical protein BpHYR1_036284 [Brachionus plicatilis]|uniref:Uncharacterized protein n=1 Tax=Brachionus plicatilis TaxID=10195 RepID=A0A3M7P692_BRAPC|nr:hypothetical protein BpHYR1_036284 [Brachionus plicatilis]
MTNRGLRIRSTRQDNGPFKLNSLIHSNYHQNSKSSNTMKCIVTHYNSISFFASNGVNFLINLIN